MADLDVTDVPDDHRYELRRGEEVLGHVAYLRRGGRRILTHTEVAPGHRGEGLGSALAEMVLERARAAGEPVVPLCPFFERYIHDHDEYAEVVDAGVMACFEQPATTS